MPVRIKPVEGIGKQRHAKRKGEVINPRHLEL